MILICRFCGINSLVNTVSDQHLNTVSVGTNSLVNTVSDQHLNTVSDLHREPREPTVTTPVQELIREHAGEVKTAFPIDVHWDEIVKMVQTCALQAFGSLPGQLPRKPWISMCTWELIRNAGALRKAARSCRARARESLEDELARKWSESAERYCSLCSGVMSGSSFFKKL